MPRLPIDYSKTIIYKLVCRDLSVKELYVGATTNWVNRKANHKINCNDENRIEYNLKVYQYIRANNSWENWNMILVEKYPCCSQLESAKRERYWTETLGATLNSQIQGRTQKEWIETHTEHIAEQLKKYRANHKEQIVEYRENHKKEATEQHLLYYEKNKEQILKKRAEFRAENKEQIEEYLSKYRQIKTNCPCGSVISKCEKSRHNKSKKHINFIQVNGATA